MGQLIEKKKKSDRTKYWDRHTALFRANWICPLISMFVFAVLSIYLMGQYGETFISDTTFIVIAAIPAGILAVTILVEFFIFLSYILFVRKFDKVGKVNMKTLKIRIMVCFFIKLALAIAIIALRIVFVMLIVKEGQQVVTPMGIGLLFGTGFSVVVYFIPCVVLGKTLSKAGNYL